MAGNAFTNLLGKILLPSKTGGGKGTANTPTFNSSNKDQVLSLPTYREHLSDLYDDRLSSDSKTLIKKLFVNDPDMSSAVNAFLTVANTTPLFIVKDVNGMVDRAGQQMLNQVLMYLTTRVDYSKGFAYKPDVSEISENWRYMCLLRGACATELVLDKLMGPAELRTVDMGSIQWYEKEPGKYSPVQKAAGGGKDISLDIPTFFVSFFRRDPTSIYTNSPFVSAINTIAARQQVVNDLYRIMQLTGYPRMEVKVLEEVVMKNAPANIKSDGKKLREYMDGQLTSIQGLVSNIRVDQAFIHYDSIEPGILNEKAPGMSMDITGVINTLNAQNQAGLRSMATILGRGESGVNTASVEARIFSMTAEELNEPVAKLWSDVLTLAIRLMGSQSVVHCRFRPVEMRPDLELEPQRVIKATRLKEDLSLGIIDDDEYHLEMYGRLRPDSAPELSGTGFMSKSATAANAENVSPNSDPLGRSVTPEGSKMAKSKQVTKK